MNVQSKHQELLKTIYNKEKMAQNLKKRTKKQFQKAQNKYYKTIKAWMKTGKYYDLKAGEVTESQTKAHSMIQEYYEDHAIYYGEKAEEERQKQSMRFSQLKELEQQYEFGAGYELL